MSSLPPELYTAVLSYIPKTSLQQTVHSLSFALPHYSCYLISNHLFTHVNLRYSGQVLRLYLHLRAHPDHINRIRTFVLSSWTVDADVVVNLLRLLPNIREMNLCIGLNFAPEHFDEILERPMTQLKFLGLRFKPYVERATYLQFLKGAYFDSILTTLSTWRPSGMPSISIVQEPLDDKYKHKKEFAQPLVFFRLDPFSNLVRSPYMESVRNFRLRIPSRQVAKYIYAYPGSLPNLELLDLSTSSVLEVEVEELLVRFTDLQHLILDDCNILWGEWREGDWAAFGKNLAIVGAKRARKREQKVKQWLESTSVNVGGVETMLVNPGEPHHTRRIKKGRRGLATSSISLREKEPSSGANSGIGSAQGVRRGGDVPRIRVLPSLPTLLSFSTTTHPSIGEDDQESIRREFAAGWAQGLAQLSATRKRMLQSWMNGFRIVRENEDEVAVDENGLEGLTDLVAGDEDMIALDGNELLELCPCPVLCFAETQGGGIFGHIDGCGHLVDNHWAMWDNNDRVLDGTVHNK